MAAQRKMKRKREGVAFGFTVADARHTLAGAKKHWAQIAPYGVTQADLKSYEGQIESCSGLAAGQSDVALPLEDAREALKDLIGEYRPFADLVARGLTGLDAKCAAALGAEGKFPNTDALIKAYVTGIAKRMKPYAAKLSARSFGKDQQEKLAQATRGYLDALSARGKERGQLKSARLTRDTAFSLLREMTSYFRRAGRTALRKSSERADFDRVIFVRQPTRPVKAPPAAPPATAVTKS